MSKTEKLLKRLESRPTDFTWSELCTLLQGLGYALRKASGSGRKFIDLETGESLYIHEPHPSSILKLYQVRDAILFLTQRGHFL